MSHCAIGLAWWLVLAGLPVLSVGFAGLLAAVVLTLAASVAVRRRLGRPRADPSRIP